MTPHWYSNATIVLPSHALTQKCMHTVVATSIVVLYRLNLYAVLSCNVKFAVCTCKDNVDRYGTVSNIIAHTVVCSVELCTHVASANLSNQ